MTRKNRDLEYALDANGNPTDVLVGCIRGCDACKREICLLDYVSDEEAKPYDPYLEEESELNEEEKEMFYGYTTEELDYEE